MSNNWLDDFVAHTSYGETPAKIMFWVGVATIAGALQRKVWIEEDGFQWTPNFYLLIVGRPGTIRKSTSIGRGLSLLKKVPDVDFGPQIVTWQQLISHMAAAKREVLIGCTSFEMSCVTIGLSEFGSLFDPSNRELVDILTDIWDAKLETVRKETKTMGDDEIVNPWLNILACTTPDWIAANFSAGMVGTGFASRPIFLYADRPLTDVAYPSRNRPEGKSKQHEANALIARLTEMSHYAGEFKLTEAAYEWGDDWYKKMRVVQRKLNDTEAGFSERKQTHLHKLAMVISAAKSKFPIIDVEEMIEADYHIQQLEEDTKRIFGFVGQTATSRTAREIIETIERSGEMCKKDLFKKYFFRTMSSTEFEESLKSVIVSGQMELTGPIDNLTIRMKGK